GVKRGKDFPASGAPGEERSHGPQRPIAAAALEAITQSARACRQMGMTRGSFARIDLRIEETRAAEINPLKPDKGGDRVDELLRRGAQIVKPHHQHLVAAEYVEPARQMLRVAIHP